MGFYLLHTLLILVNIYNSWNMLRLVSRSENRYMTKSVFVLALAATTFELFVIMSR
jgi:hypothetical protein